MRKVSASCLATIGVVSNADQKNIKIGKAGEIDGEERGLRREVWP